MATKTKTKTTPAKPATKGVDLMVLAADLGDMSDGIATVILAGRAKLRSVPEAKQAEVNAWLDRLEQARTHLQHAADLIEAGE